MKVVDCTYESHALQILDVFNDAILTSTALFDYKPRAPESMVGWFKAKEQSPSRVSAPFAPGPRTSTRWSTRCTSTRTTEAGVSAGPS
jgi:hypothetical protein